MSGLRAEFMGVLLLVEFCTMVDEQGGGAVRLRAKACTSMLARVARR